MGGEKPYPCLECDARFKQLCHLKQHMRAKHTGERPYQCRFCDKKFVQMCHLQQHERSSNHANAADKALGLITSESETVKPPRVTKSKNKNSPSNNPITSIANFDNINRSINNTLSTLNSVTANLNGPSLLSSTSFASASQVPPMRLAEINDQVFNNNYRQVQRQPKLLKATWTSS